jgi:hypothetical protein
MQVQKEVRQHHHDAIAPIERHRMPEDALPNLRLLRFRPSSVGAACIGGAAPGFAPSIRRQAARISSTDIESLSAIGLA